MYHLRQLLGITWRDYVPNVEVLRRAGLPSIEALLASAKIRWAGHVARMVDTRLPKAIMYGELADGTRSVGDQKLRYKDVLKRNLKVAEGPVDNWEERTQDRLRYRDLTRLAIVRVEESRGRAYVAARERRHDLPNPANALQCPHCNKLCRGRAGHKSKTSSVGLRCFSTILRRNRREPYIYTYHDTIA